MLVVGSSPFIDRCAIGALLSFSESSRSPRRATTYRRRIDKRQSRFWIFVFEKIPSTEIMAHRLVTGELVAFCCLFGAVLCMTTTTLPTTAYTLWVGKDEPIITKPPLRANKVEFAKGMRYPLGFGNAELVMATSTVPTKTTTTEKMTPPQPKSSNELPLYRLNGSNGQACILLQVDALIIINYKTKLGDEMDANIYVPNNATVTGSCERDTSATMSLKWESFVFTWFFAKTLGNERWYVDKIELTFSAREKQLEHIETPYKTIKLLQKSMLFPTPVGKSYTCEDQKIRLTDGIINATVDLRVMKLQPFKFKNNEFADEFSCSSLSARIGRSETAPVAVGSTLAAAVLLTITGYAGYRYFKVKKVKYDTME